MSSIHPGCFCMCLGDFVDCSCPNVDKCSKCRSECSKEIKLPKGKKKRLTLGDVGNSSHFQFVSKKDAKAAQQKYVPPNTEKSTQWATKVFANWKQARQLAGEECCLEDLLERADPSDLAKWLSLFAVEARQTSGDFYSPATISQLLTGLLRYMRSVNTFVPNFMDKKAPRFAPFHNTLNHHYHVLRTKNIGTQAKHAEIFTKEEEALLWESGTLDLKTPQALLNAVFFLNGKNFCLRGGEEHWTLKISQITCCDQPVASYTYVENGSKNWNGTFAQRYIPNKSVPIYASPNLRNRCHVRVLDVYYSKLPKEALAKDVFYVRPLPRIPAQPDLPWFTSIPVGRNELNKMVQKMCCDAGISGRKTNHSLRTIGASQLFQANVLEKIIRERTRHRSVEGLQQYERTTTEQHQAITEVLGSDAVVSYQSIAAKQTISQPPSMAMMAPTGPAVPTFNMTGCTVNICYNPAPLPPPLILEITQAEFAQLLEDFP